MEVKMIVEYVAHTTFTPDNSRPVTMHYVRARSADKADTKTVFLLKVIDKPFDFANGTMIKVSIQKMTTKFPYVNELVASEISAA